MSLIIITIIIPLISLAAAAVTEVTINRVFGHQAAVLVSLSVGVILGILVSKKVLPDPTRFYHAVPILILAFIFTVVFGAMANIEGRVLYFTGIRYEHLDARAITCGPLIAMCSIFVGWIFNLPRPSWIK